MCASWASFPVALLGLLRASTSRHHWHWHATPCSWQTAARYLSAFPGQATLTFTGAPLSYTQVDITDPLPKNNNNNKRMVSCSLNSLSLGWWENGQHVPYPVMGLLNGDGNYGPKPLFWAQYPIISHLRTAYVPERASSSQHRSTKVASCASL